MATTAERITQHLDIEDCLSEALDEALADRGYWKLVEQPYADDLTREAVKSLRDDDTTLAQAARFAVQYLQEYLVPEVPEVPDECEG